MNKGIIVVAVLVVLFVLGGVLWWYGFDGSGGIPEGAMLAPDDSGGRLMRMVEKLSVAEMGNKLLSSEKTVSFQSYDGVHAAFAFTANIPDAWEVQVVPEIEAVNIYDPRVPGETDREKSQIFLRHFKANDFLTLSTVTIYGREVHEVGGRIAVTYDIEKKPGVSDFPHQPSWRNTRHMVTDIRVQETSPSEFIVIGKNPSLESEVFESFVSSIKFEGDGKEGLVEPVEGFVNAVTLKPFGKYVTPENSPVQPERFSGYHTAADAELSADTVVLAVADGEVLRSGWISGYGGMVAVEHVINGDRMVGVYGHLDSADLPDVGGQVVAGDKLGVLGDAYSEETDGERSHLHFGLYVGEGIDVRGYVAQKAELGKWVDPVNLFAGG